MNIGILKLFSRNYVTVFQPEFFIKSDFFIFEWDSQLNILFEICREIREKLKKNVLELSKNLPGFRPGLAIVQVGGREDSNVYIRMKLKAASEIGIFAEHVQLPKNITEGELMAKVRKLYKH
jgi:hypothetical protein